ncbi:Biopolymer transport protein ExbB/TolQ [Nannocystis exedens]|uniref:Biopolymer transport protein ExbB/TolQ n=2 Tax=Nannocystis TaxID=53 RepID=A0A1I2F0R6_9BACT|nr:MULTISPECIES: MotA/TolQ/ExbB proton channel family protein [Nannocystis]PCC69543.1 MotA/TolQ/ExbB proton channel family protein [Nannocystis exedens]WAS95427.1 MotA/TolQ/ExbB proton channel family protein [Nannocystis poenicansa]SFE98101.1 Biopolymer transport protein ExbB/TolQ [Nannocystis exedens]
MDFAQFYQEGGVWMHPIAVCAVLGAGVMIERFIFLFFRFNINGAQFFNQIQKLVMANNIDRAIKLCNAADKAALARVMKAGLTRANKSESDIAAAIEEAMLEVSPAITKRISMIAAVANIATLLGLLGTIFGMIDAFTAVAVAAADQRSQALAKGISIAINTTGFGLMVAIPLLSAQVFIQGLAKKIADEVDLYAVKLENLLAARVRQG